MNIIMEVTTHEKVIFTKKSQTQPESKGVFDLGNISELLPEDCVFEGYSNKYGFLA